MIGIIGAMVSEVKAIYQKMTSKQEIKLCDLIFYKGFINEKDNTLMAATLLLESRIYKYRIGYVPGSFLIDYNNDNL